MRTRKIVEIGPEVTVLETLCPECRQTTRHELDTVAFRRWQGGEYVQRAFPTMSVDKREQLISGMCGGCWEKLFAEEDDPRRRASHGAQGVPAGWKTWRVVLTRTNGQQSAHYILAGHLENAVQGACEEAGVERGEAGLKVEVVG